MLLLRHGQSRRAGSDRQERGRSMLRLAVLDCDELRQGGQAGVQEVQAGLGRAVRH